MFGVKSGNQKQSETPANTVTEENTTIKNTKENTSLPGLQTSPAPWPAEIDHLKERLALINLPALPEEGTALHTHEHLDIFIHGKPVTIPMGIGINESAGFISPIHVHDETGIIHVESPTIENFTLGQFFDVWGVRFDKASIGGYESDASNTLEVFVNGQKVEGSPREISLTEHEEIAITFGTQKEEPAIPKSYSFPMGL